MSEERKDDTKLQALYVELDSVEYAMNRALFHSTWQKLNGQRAALLGQIKELERQKNDDGLLH